MQLTDIDWDMKDANTREYTHGIHVYPARMLPQIARILIDHFSEKGDLVLDPFCGSGTVLLEASLAQRKSVGIDINPLATLIAQVKTTPIDPQKLWSDLSLITDLIETRIASVRDGQKPPTYEFDNQKQIDHWFKKEVQRDLSIIKSALESLAQSDSLDFFKVVFSDTVRKVSNTRNNEYKLYRLSKEALEGYQPDTFGTFQSFAKKGIDGMTRLYERVKGLEYPVPHVRNENLLSTNLENEKFDLMVTSPPYGDSHTTVGYGQFSKFPLIWLGGQYSLNIPTCGKMLGGRKRDDALIPSDTFHEQLDMIRKNDEEHKNKRWREVVSFFADYQDCVKRVFDSLKEGKYACFVVGNRTVREVRIRMDLITTEIGEYYGFSHHITIPRTIPTKRHPFTQKLYVDPKWTDVFERKTAKTIENIVKEHIVILRKQ